MNRLLRPHAIVVAVTGVLTLLLLSLGLWAAARAIAPAAREYLTARGLEDTRGLILWSEAKPIPADPTVDPAAPTAAAPRGEFRIRYRYRVDGTEHVGERYGYYRGNGPLPLREAHRLASTYHAGRPVQVYYERGDPTASAISTEASAVAILLLYFAGIGLVLLLLLLVQWALLLRDALAHRRVLARGITAPCRIPRLGRLRTDGPALTLDYGDPLPSLLAGALLGLLLALAIPLISARRDPEALTTLTLSHLIVLFPCGVLFAVLGASLLTLPLPGQRRLTLDPAARTLTLTRRRWFGFLPRRRTTPADRSSQGHPLTLPFSDIAAWTCETRPCTVTVRTTDGTVHEIARFRPTPLGHALAQRLTARLAAEQRVLATPRQGG